MTCAPFLTCARAISAAASNWPSAIEPLELAAAEHVGALADEDGPVVHVDLEQLDARRRASCCGSATRRGFLPAAAAASAADVRRRRAAAAADDVDPALVHEARRARAASDSGRLGVLAVGVRQARRSGSRRSASSRAPRGVRMWSVMNSGPGRAVDADREQRRVHDRGVERLDVLAREHRAHRLDRDRDHDRHAPADLGERLLDADQPGLEVARVLRRLEQQRRPRRPRAGRSPASGSGRSSRRTSRRP